MTLAQLRALLALSHGPAVERLTDRTPEGVARAYLARRTCWLVPAAPSAHGEFMARPAAADADTVDMIAKATLGEIATCEADLTDPGTVVAVRAALALARGFDPSNGVKWTRNGADNAWILDASDWCAFATSTAARSVTPSRRVIEADLVGMEPDSTRALVLAVESVLSASSNLVQAV